MTGDVLGAPIPDWPLDAVASFVSAEYGLGGTLRALEGERGQNVLIDSARGRYLVKILNPATPAGEADMYQAVLRHLAAFSDGPATPVPVAASNGELTAAASYEGQAYLVNVQSFVEGRPLSAGQIDPWELGGVAAALDRRLWSFFHPAAARRLLWDVRQVGGLVDHLDRVDDPALRKRIAALIEAAVADTIPRTAHLPSQIIHNDLNPANLIGGEGGGIAGVVDFGDMVHGPRIIELAVAAAYLLGEEPAGAVAALVDGYTARLDLEDDEVAILPDLIPLRLVQSILIGAWRAGLHPANEEYILSDAEASRVALERYDPEAVRRALAPGRTRVQPLPDLAARRARVLAPGLRLSYDEPLHLVAGSGVWVESADGRRYLDAYNNVPQVGHGHPAVAHAIHAQAVTLNTNTRYLTDPVVVYGERLLARFPAELDTVYFTNSGSEANDLAMRIARAVTGGEGFVVTEHAYHGGTSLTAAVSPEESVGQMPPWVATMPPPPADLGSGAEGAARELTRRGHRPAAVLVDTAFASDGIHDPAESGLDGLAAAARAIGALYIADEVQAGLGRVGPGWWGFASAAAVPDIVTLGKPLGNGHPIGAVVTRRRYAEEFGYYFSTYGGNTVSAAAGLAVLDITETARLPELAGRVGAHLRDALAGLGDHGIAAVRGAGMMTGVELVGADGSPDAVRTHAIVERLRAGGVLIRSTGPAGSVLKIRPPLVFTEEHAAIVVEALAAALAATR